MSIATTERQLLGSGLGTLPRVNLMPPEIAERVRFRRIQVGLGGAVLGTLGVVALLFVLASASLAEANDRLETETARNTALQAETARYADVTAAYRRAAAAQAQLTEAMGQEIRWSTMLNDLSLTVPDSVWIKSLVFTQVPAVAPVGALPGIGTLTVNGVGFSHDDVAVWLEALAGQKTYANPAFSSSTESLLGTRKIVNFGSTASLTPASLSGRFTAPAGG